MIHFWQYNGCAPWDEIVQWCADHLSDKVWVTNKFETIQFYSEADYTAFLLKWGG